MASKKDGMKQWHSTTAKLKKADLDAITLSFPSLNGGVTLSTKKRTGVKAKSRKDLRKEKRLESKTKQHASWMKKRGIETKPLEKEIHRSKKKRKKKKKNVVGSNEIDETKTQTNNVDDLLVANEKEDKLISSLERKLRMKKRKNLPSKFAEDGLDYLLEVCEPVENPGLYMSDSEGDDLVNGGKENIDDEPEVANTKAVSRQSNAKIGEISLLSEKVKGVQESNKNEQILQNLEDESNSENENVLEDIEENSVDDEDIFYGESEVQSDDEDAEELGDNAGDNHAGVKKQENCFKQQNDIDAISSLQKGTKYVPPQLRKLTGSTTEEKKLERLKKQLKGLVNRLSEANLASISQDIEKMYFTHSKNDTNSILSKLLFEACIMPTHMPIKLLMEHMMLVAILHSNIGNEVGAFFIQSLIEKFDDFHKEGGKYLEGKECDNVLMMIAQLYNFKVIGSLLMYDLIKELLKSFTERDIEMLMLLLKSIGPGLRHDDPGSLKEIILEIQSKAATCSDLVKQSRVRFMLDVINALRNNNLRKIPQYDPSLVEDARKHIKAVLKNRDSAGDMQLRVSLKDLLEAKNKGRWWVIGSAWAGRDDVVDHQATNTLVDTADSKLFKLAKQQRMNTDIRRNIFFVVMSSEDYIDCFNKLLKLNLKEKQAREIVHVVIDCCLQEKIYNPYYAFLAQRLCEFSRSNQVTFQYSFWDRFKLLSTSSPQSLENLAKLIAHLFASNGLSIAILKIIGFGTIDKPSVRFFTRLFTILLTEYPVSAMKKVFARIAPIQKLSLLREGLKIFLRHFLLSKSTKKEETVDHSRLTELVEIAEAALDGREVVKF